MAASISPVTPSTVARHTTRGGQCCMQYGRTAHETMAQGHPPYCDAHATHTATYGVSRVDYCETHAMLEHHRWDASLTEIGA